MYLPFSNLKTLTLAIFFNCIWFGVLKGTKKRHSPNLFKPQDFPSVPILVEYACTGNKKKIKNEACKKYVEIPLSDGEEKHEAMYMAINISK